MTEAEAVYVNAEISQADSDNLQVQYNDIIDSHIMELRQCGMPDGIAGAQGLLQVFNGPTFENIVPFLDVTEGVLALLDIVTHTRTEPFTKEALLSQGLDAFFPREARRLGALSDLADTEIRLDNPKYADAMLCARAQLDTIYILTGVTRDRVQRAGLLQRKRQTLTPVEFKKYRHFAYSIPPNAVDNAYRKMVATEYKTLIHTLGHSSEDAKQRALNKLIQQEISFGSSEVIKTLEAVELVFITVCRLLDVHPAPLTVEEIQTQGYDALIGEWLRLDPIPNVTDHIAERINDDKSDQLGALPLLRVMLDLALHASGMPRAVLLQVGVSMREDDIKPKGVQEH